MQKSKDGQESAIQHDLRLPHDYEIVTGVDLPPGSGAGRVVYYPPGSEDGGSDGLIVKVIPPNSAPWTGVFAFGRMCGTATSGIFSCPNSAQLCVVARGEGYIVQVDSPHTWEEVQMMGPIMDARVIPEAGLIVFTSPFDLVAYGTGGLAWRTPRLSFDGLTVTDVSPSMIRGRAWDAPKEKEVDFEVDLETGQCCGGSSPELYRAQGLII